MMWDDISASTSNWTERVFRKASATTASTASSHAEARYRLLAGLNDAVIEKSVSLGGLNGDAGGVGKFGNNVAQNWQDQVGAKTLEATFMVSVFPQVITNLNEYGVATDTHSARVSYYITWANGGVAVITPLTAEGSFSFTSDDELVVGSAGWMLAAKAGQNLDITSTNSYNEVRVDGHADPMVETYWKFKNLREPD